MSLDLLDAPVRLTWDIPDDAGKARDVDLAAIAGRIADAGVFFVTLQGRPLACSRLPDILGVLSGSQLLLESRGEEDEMRALEQLPAGKWPLLLNVSRFVTEPAGLDTETLKAVVSALRGLGHEPTLSLTPLKKNINYIGDVVRFCSHEDIARFKLPNAHIGDSFHEYSAADLPRWQDLERFRALWQDVLAEGVPLPQMDIHDLFLWEIMTPGQDQNRSEYGGCQAANSLGHIDSDGVVHPCAAWPTPLGCLPGQSLDDIWAGTQRRAIRDRIAATAEGCRGCKDLQICFGGCRGLAYLLNSAAGDRDLMCSGPR